MQSQSSSPGRLSRTLIRLAYRTENGIRNWFAGHAVNLGWKPAVIPYSGYSDGRSARVLGRIVLAPKSVSTASRDGARGWKLLLTLESPRTPIEITVGGSTITAFSDDGGIVDAHIDLDTPVEPGTVEAHLDLPGRDPVPAVIHVASSAPVRGVICDIDDTAWVTGIAHPLRAAWRTLSGTSDSRKSVPGMAQLLQAAVAGYEYPGVAYVSNGPWNFVGPVIRFLAKHEFPPGAVLMTDWGVTPTRWFRDGQEHKRSSIAQLMEDFPQVTWVLVGDDGEHDPDIYAAAVKAHPGRIAAIALRTVSLKREGQDVSEVDGVPVLRGDHGEELLPLLRDALGSHDESSDLGDGLDPSTNDEWPSA